MVKKIGIIGYSEGNGHPYSFSSIFNGYNSKKFDKEWSIIQNYLETKPKVDFINNLARVEKIWTPSIERSLSIKESCNINTISTISGCRSVEGAIDPDSSYYAAQVGGTYDDVYLIVGLLYNSGSTFELN